MMKLKQRLAISYVRTKFKLLSVISKRRTAEQAFQLFCTPMERSLPNHTLKNATAISFELDGKKINGFRWNSLLPWRRVGDEVIEDEIKKVLILHGFGSAAHKFERFVSPLVKKGYEVLAFDAPAHGSSSGITTNALEYSQMIEKVVELYGPIQSFIAHSFGGIGIALAMENIPHDANTRIVFIAPATETSSAIDSAFSLLKIKDATVRKEMDNIIFELSGRHTSWFSIRRAIKNIQAKILWIHDEDDDVTPLADALKVKEDNHPHINFVITKGLGHRRIYHDADVKKMVVDFL